MCMHMRLGERERDCTKDQTTGMSQGESQRKQTECFHIHLVCLSQMCPLQMLRGRCCRPVCLCVFVLPACNITSTRPNTEVHNHILLFCYLAVSALPQAHCDGGIQPKTITTPTTTVQEVSSISSCCTTWDARACGAMKHTPYHICLPLILFLCILFYYEVIVTYEQNAPK